MRTSHKREYRRRIERFGLTTIALLGLAAEMIDDATGLTSLSGRRGIYKFARKMDMGEYQLKSALQGLERGGLVKRSTGGFLITPRGKRKIRLLKLHAPRSVSEEWDGKWRIVIFDIPESKRTERQILRSILKRKGFVRLQYSVFVAPFADFEELDLARREYNVERCVNFLIAKSAETDDDSLLRKRFGL